MLSNNESVCVSFFEVVIKCYNVVCVCVHVFVCPCEDVCCASVSIFPHLPKKHHEIKRSHYFDTSQVFFPSFFFFLYALSQN